MRTESLQQGTSPWQLELRLERALERSVEDCKAFEEQYLDSLLAGGWKTSVIIFGASALGRRTLAGLRNLGVEPLAFADNRASQSGAVLDGLPVMSPAQTVEAFGTAASFIVCVWRSKPVMSQLALMGCRSAAEFKALFWRYPTEFLPNMRVDRPHLILQKADTVRRVFQTLSDDASRDEYVEQIEWLLEYQFASLPVRAEGEQYFEKQLFQPHSQEVFVDCGAFSGDTLEAFLRHYPDVRALHAFEPEPANLAALREWCAHQAVHVRSRIVIHPLAASDRRRQLRFHADGVGSAVDPGGSIEVQAAPLDEILADEAVTFIKMDIEGAESAAIEGAASIIADRRPVLAICLYHRQDHLFSIPNRLRELVGDYHIFIRRYGDQFGDIVCYAVSPERACRGPEI